MKNKQQLSNNEKTIGPEVRQTLKKNVYIALWGNFRPSYLQQMKMYKINEK